MRRRQSIVFFVLAVLLSGLSGAFAVQTAAQDGARPKFPLKISANKRYFVDQNNRPFLYHADTGWYLFQKLDRAETELYLENRRRKGFNVIQVQLLIDGDKDFPNRDGQLPLKDMNDLATVNEKFFEHVDWVIRRAEEKGMLLSIAPAWLSCCKGGWRARMQANGPEKCRQFGRFVGNRYKNFPNVMWMMAGDRNPGEFMAVTRAMAEGIKAADPNHLMTAHPRSAFSALDVFDSESWLDVNVTYTYSPEMKSSHGQYHVYAAARKDYLRARPLPFFMIESAYENERDSTPLWIRRQAYWSLLSGATGQAMGNKPIYFFEDGWQAAMDAQASRDMAQLKALFDRFAWYRLVPDVKQELVTAGYGTFSATTDPSVGYDYVTAARADDGSFALVYLPAGNAVTVDLGKFKRKVIAQWFDPVSGEMKRVGGSPFKNQGSQVFTPPEKNAGGFKDFILVIEAAR